jgi:hypothetical protein
MRSAASAGCKPGAAHILATIEQQSRSASAWVISVS